MDFRAAYQGKRVFLTGHTGFKGSWLSEWLLSLGAEVSGYSLAPPTDPSLFVQLALEKRMQHEEADIRDPKKLSRAVRDAQPDFVFHLAAQPLVRLSYAQPRETWEVNVMGTVHVLEALRALEKPCAAVMITTDKCYENREWLHGYREDDPLGGHDPYSSSKAGAEIAIAAYRRSFFADHPVRIASARAGNVIGGGDWALDRIVPDAVRALQRGQPIPVRNKNATRPWQHVLEPLSGYLSLGAQLRDAPRLASAFNFGPALNSNRTVIELVEQLLRYWPGDWVDRSDPNAPHEAGLLNLSTEKAFHLLGWSPLWGFEETVAQTAAWYRRATQADAAPQDGLREFTQSQIEQYQSSKLQQGAA